MMPLTMQNSIYDASDMIYAKNMFLVDMKTKTKQTLCSDWHGMKISQKMQTFCVSRGLDY